MAHSRPMLSIDNVNSEEELREWVRRLEELVAKLPNAPALSFVCEYKLDGMSMALVYGRKDGGRNDGSESASQLVSESAKELRDGQRDGGGSSAAGFDSGGWDNGRGCDAECADDPFGAFVDPGREAEGGEVTGGV